jgi:hypothetical protein
MTFFALPLDTRHSALVSFDHLVRSRQHIRRNRQADLLRSFEIDDELELLRPFSRADLLALVKILSSGHQHGDMGKIVS